jgi:hypothetical protein
MERILKIINKMIKVDKSVVTDCIEMMLTGNSEEKEMLVAVMALVKSNASKAINAFVNNFLHTDKDNVDNFISACEMFGLPEENCVELLKLKGIKDVESDDASELDNIKNDIVKTIKAILED